MVNMMDDLISRQAVIDALWKALHEYEDKTEKQFQESDELDIGDWIIHRIFVQNMSDIDRQTILNLPSAQPEKRMETNGVCLDAISRQMAIDAVDKYVDKFDCIDKNFLDGLKTTKKILNDLPSVQPEIIRCKDCKWYDMTDAGGTIEPIVYKCRRGSRLWREPHDFCSRAERKEQ